MKSKLDISGLWTNGERKGTNQTEITKNKISKAKIGKPNLKLRGIKRPNFSGENHPNWKGGVTSKNKLERRRFARELREIILERDNYTCCLCGKLGGKLQVDHILNWSEYPEFRFKISNCRTLCQECHYKLTFNKDMPKKVGTWGHNLSNC